MDESIPQDKPEENPRFTETPLEEPQDHLSSSPQNDTFKFSSLNKDPNYQDLLENKIRDQAQRLLELQNYKTLCERRIKQLVPSHLFPVTEIHISQHRDIETRNNDMEIHYLNKQVADLKSLLQLKDQEIMQQMRKYDSLQEKFNKSVADSIPKNKVAFMKGDKNSLPFPSVEKIPNEKLREAYSKLYHATNLIMEEKEKIFDNLKRETIESEEQRNYIDILKQTIDTTIAKLNIGNALQSQKVHYHDRRGLTNVDLLIDFAKLKNEADKYKKDYLLSNILINELKQEIEQYKKSNEEMKYKKERINETLESGIRELELARNKVINLEEEKDILAQELDRLKVEYEENINEFNTLLKVYEQLKADFDNLYDNSQEMEQRKNKEIEGLTLDLKSTQDKLNDLKNECGELIRTKTECKKNNEELSTKLNEKIKDSDFLSQEVATLKEKLVNYDETVKEKENLLSELEKLKIEFAEIRSRDDSIDELIKNVEILKEKMNELRKENFSKDEDILKLKDSIKEKDFSLKNMTERVEDLQRIDQKFELFQNETNELLNELNYYKTLSEDYAKTIKSLNENFKFKDENAPKFKQMNEVSASQEYQQKINILSRKNEEFIKIIEDLEKENKRSESVRKKLIEDLEVLKSRDKETQKIINNFNEAKAISSSILSSAKNLNNKIILHVEPEESNKEFLDCINEYKFSIIQINNINFIDVMKSLDSWVAQIVNEFENQMNKIKDLDSAVKDMNSRSLNYDRLNKGVNNEETESENRKLKLQIKQLVDENGFLRSDHEIIRKKHEKLMRDMKWNKGSERSGYDEFERVKTEVSKYKEFQSKIASENVSAGDDLSKTLMKEKQNLEAFLNKIVKFITSKEAAKLIKDYLAVLEQISQFEKERSKIKQNVYELEASNNKGGELDSYEAQNNENSQRSEGSVSKNVAEQIRSLKNLIKEYDSKLSQKQNTLNSIEFQLNRIEVNSDEKLNTNAFEETKSFKSTTGTNIFRSNYVDKPPNSKRDNNSNNNYLSEKLDDPNKMSKPFLSTTSEGPKKVIQQKNHKILELDQLKIRKNLDSMSSMKLTGEMRNEKLDTTPSQENKFENLSRKIRSLSNQKDSAFNLMSRYQSEK